MYISPKDILKSAKLARKSMISLFDRTDEDGILSELEYNALVEFAEDKINETAPKGGKYYLSPIIYRATLPLSVGFRLVYHSEKISYDMEFPFNLKTKGKRLK